MHFYKFHGLGNDFLLLEKKDFIHLANSEENNFVKTICNRHYGAGADGLIVINSTNSLASDFQMTIWNADGGRAEISGNGLRCTAAYCYMFQSWKSNSIRIATDAGLKIIKLISQNNNDFLFKVEMGSPIFAPQHIPVNLDNSPPLINIPISIDGIHLQTTITSIGNPHCSVFIDELPEKTFHLLGSKLETHPIFPNRTNVEFIKVIDNKNLEVMFWERGVGPTASSGTGSCAAAVAAILQGKTSHEVVVASKSGELKICWDGNSSSVFLTGPASFVYQGKFESKT